MDFSANNLPPDIAESRENPVDQIHGNAEPNSRRDMIKDSPGKPGEAIKPATSFHHIPSEKKDKNEDHGDAGMQSIRPATARRLTPAEEMPGTARVKMKSMNEPEPGNIPQGITLKENPVIIKHDKIILNEEPVFSRETEKKLGLSSDVLPVSSKEAEPFPQRELKMPVERSAGVFGEPPGAISSQNLKGDQGSVNDHHDNMANPVIKVTIGQINVRAVSPPPPVAVPKPREAQKPLLSLEDYLKQRSKR
jgi:hypothetical protein